MEEVRVFLRERRGLVDSLEGREVAVSSLWCRCWSRVLESQTRGEVAAVTLGASGREDGEIRSPRKLDLVMREGEEEVL